MTPVPMWYLVRLLWACSALWAWWWHVLGLVHVVPVERAVPCPCVAVAGVLSQLGCDVSCACCWALGCPQSPM